MELKDSALRTKHFFWVLIFCCSVLALFLCGPLHAQGALTITTQGMDDSNNNFPYSNTLQATGGTPPYTWTITSGTLPKGLQLTASTGTVAGTPDDKIQTYSITFQVTDDAGNSASIKIPFNNVYGFRTTPIPASFFGMSIYDQNNVYPSVPIGYLGKGDATHGHFSNRSRGYITGNLWMST